MSGYHEAFIILNKDTGNVFVDEKGQFQIYATLKQACAAVTQMDKGHLPTTDIFPYRVMLPWK